MSIWKNKKQQKLVKDGVVINLTTSTSNVHSAITNKSGQVIFKTSAGALNVRGSLKSKEYAYEEVATEIGRQLQMKKISSIILKFNGSHYLRKKFLRSLLKMGIHILGFIHKVNIPHNGCKVSGPRRL